MAVICLKCASAECTCGRLARLAAEATLVEAAAGMPVSGSEDPNPDASIELASLLLAMQRAGGKVGDAG